MIATVERAPVAIPAAVRQALGEREARDLALGYLRYASACWRGDTVTAPFATALSAFWRLDMPFPPESRPDAVSPHGGGGRGIRWYQRDGQILGYVAGASGGYVVPVTEVPRLLRCVPDAQCVIHRRGEACPRPASDRRERYRAMDVLWTPALEFADHPAQAIACG